MTMLGRGKRSSPDKSGKGRKRGKGGADQDPAEGLTKDEAAAKATEAEEKARKAAEQAARAEEAAEAARLAEVAAARAKEAARLAQIAADAASADAGTSEDADEPEKPGDAATSLEKKRDGRDGSEVAPEGDDGSANESAASTGVSVDTETAVEDDEDLDDEDLDEDDEDDEDEGDEADSEVGTETAAADSDSDADDEPVRSSGRRGRPVVVVSVLAVVAVALAAGAVFLTMQVREHQATVDARRDAVAAAENAAKALSSYDYRTLENDLKAASATTTGELRSEFDKLAQQLRTQATQQQAVSTTTVLKAGAVSATPDEVVVLVYANRASATSQDTEARLPESLRIQMTMVEKDGKWLAQELKVIS
ncbi:hypothetical protein ACFHW2_04610 [Actinomadura sp. LOL_016]|uniref:hypothetical protein n=1 Tax=unclassified Actinomadura TaxID=2626254 RepID=UPI003A7FC155